MLWPWPLQSDVKNTVIKSFSYIQFLGFVYNERERQVIADISVRHVLQKNLVFCSLDFHFVLPKKIRMQMELESQESVPRHILTQSNEPKSAW